MLSAVHTFSGQNWFLWQLVNCCEVDNNLDTVAADDKLSHFPRVALAPVMRAVRGTDDVFHSLTVPDEAFVKKKQLSVCLDATLAVRM